jgi:uncharacterized iron-regulated membrane protein
MSRKFWVLLHRYAGLSTALFLIVVGLTGSLLAFYSELEYAINPQFRAAHTGAPRLDVATLIEKAEALAPEAQVDSVWKGDPDSVLVSMSPRIDSATGRTHALDFDQLVLDPYTGRELGRRTWGEIREGWVNLMPFIYKLHYMLALGEAGGWILGITALVWTIDCFVALYLTLPAWEPDFFSRDRKKRKGFGAGRSFLQRWKPAWQVKWKASSYRVNFDLHRAGGLWLWAILLIFAWSSVYMNLGTVYSQVTRLVFEFHDPWTELPEREKPLEQPALDWRQAENIGIEHMARAAAEHGFSIEKPISFRIDRAKGVYIYHVRSSLDIQDEKGETRVFFDADTGEQRMLFLPRGQYGGNTVTAWLFALHTAKVFGLPYRILVCLLGFAIVMLAVTGIIIWLRKRRARSHRSVTAAAPIGMRIEKSSSK